MDKILEDAYDSENFRKQAHELVDILADYLKEKQSLNPGTVIPWKEPADNLKYWQLDFQQPLQTNPNELFKEIIENSTHLHHPHYMGHQVSVPAPLSALAGLVSSILNNGMAVYEMGLVSNPIERIIVDWLAHKLGYTHQNTGFLTSGGTLANLTALLAIRAVKAPEDVWTEGVTNRLAIMVSEEAHYCIDRAARIMGLGTAGIIKIPVNTQFQMRTELLEEHYQNALSSGYQVIAVIGSACSTSTGAYDDLTAIGEFCRKNNLWFHVDGAHGAAVAVSDKYSYLLKGIEQADSVIVDLHKMMLVPALATALIFKNPAHSFQTFHQKAQYLWNDPESNDWFDSGKRTFECTKLMMAIKIYALLRTYGESLFSSFIDTVHDLAKDFASMLTGNKKFELAIAPQSNIVCFRYRAENEAMSNELNAKIRRLILEKGDFYIVQTNLKGKLFLRVSLMNPATQVLDLEELLKTIELIAQSDLTHN